MAKPEFRQVTRPRVSDQVVEQITEMIMSGVLEVGDQLPVTGELARQLSVSQVPIREAFFSLEQTGLLTIKRGTGGGVFVADPAVAPFGKHFALMLQLGKARVSDLTEARLSLEPQVAMLAAQRAEKVHIQKLEESIVAYEDSVLTREKRSPADMDFHNALAEATGNVVMVMMVNGLVSLLYDSVRDHKFFRKDRLKGIESHKRILEAIKAKDPGAAHQRMTEHVEEMVTYWKCMGNYPKTARGN